MNDNEKISAEEKLIREKMQAGLSRDQAIEVIAAQKQHDAQLAEQEEAHAEKAKADAKAKKQSGKGSDKSSAENPPAS